MHAKSKKNIIWKDMYIQCYYCDYKQTTGLPSIALSEASGALKKAQQGGDKVSFPSGNSAQCYDAQWVGIVRKVPSWGIEVSLEQKGWVWGPVYYILNACKKSGG